MPLYSVALPKASRRRTINPYHHTTFFEFFGVLFKRLWAFITGGLPSSHIVSDEVQILVLTGVAASAALVGCFLMLRRMTMLANSLSHTILLGIVIAYISTHLIHDEHTSTSIDIKTMLIASLFTGIATTFCTEFLTKVMRLQEDASTGLVFTSFFAIAIVLVTLYTRNAHIGTEVVMGNVDGLHPSDIRLGWLVLAGNVVIFSLLFKQYQITTFDPRLAKTLGVSLVFINYLLMVQVSATAVAAFRAVGVLMVLAFITAPPLTARLLTNRLKNMLLVSVGVGMLGSLVGVALSRHLLSAYQLPLSTAGIVVCTLVALYGLALLFAPERGLIAIMRNRSRWRRRQSNGVA